MSRKDNKSGSDGNFLTKIGVQIRLIGRLMLDRRVNFLLKLIPIASLIYLINPVDIPTPLDDIGVVWLGFAIFIELCPPEIVNEHLANIHRVVDVTGRDSTAGDGQVIDAEFREVSGDSEEEK